MTEQPTTVTDPNGLVGTDGSDELRHGRWAVVAAAVAGTSHEESGLPCQDAVAWWSSPPESARQLLVVTAADGAGSAPLADVGARTAVEEVVRQARLLAEGAADRPEPDDVYANGADALSRVVTGIRDLFAAAWESVHHAAGEVGVPARHLATTLMVALVTQEAVALGQIGDGIMAVRIEDGSVVSPVSPQRGEYANESTFLTSGGELPEISLATFSAADVRAFALSSDGLRLLITEDVVLGVPYEPFFTDLFTGVQGGLQEAELAAFLVSAEDRTGDDKSLVVAVRRT